jgi:hypothetical protein
MHKSQVDLSFLYMQIRQLRQQSNMVDQIVKVMRRLRCYGWRQAGRPKVEVYLMVDITRIHEIYTYRFDLFSTTSRFGQGVRPALVLSF